MWATFIAPAFVVTINFLIYFNRPELFSANEANPWILFTNNSLSIWCIFMMPMFITLITFYINFTEHRANGWKYIYSLPLPKFSIFSAKFIVGLIIVFISTIVYYILNYLAIKTLSIIYTNVPFENYSSALQILFTFMNVFIAGIEILAIQFFVSLLVHNFIFPIGFDVSLTVATAMLLRWEHSDLIPYAYPFYARMVLDVGELNNLSETTILSIVVGIIFFIVGYVFHWRTNIK